MVNAFLGVYAILNTSHFNKGVYGEEGKGERLIYTILTLFDLVRMHYILNNGQQGSIAFFYYWICMGIIKD
jgi:hypothetical protein